MARILVIEDEATLRATLCQSLEMDGHEASEAACIRDAWDLSRNAEYDAIVTDLNLVGESGLELIERFRADGFDGLIVVVTAFGTIDTAISAMKRGADEFIQKPVSLQELGLVISRGLKLRKAQTRLALLDRIQHVQASEGEVIGESDAWLSAIALANRFADLTHPSAAGEGVLPTILLLGETGTGKGALASLIHARDPAVSGKEPPPFVHVNCAALPASLIEGELFGHEKGAFTDAKDVRLGLFELASGGTLFLDEIGELPLEMQSKLLLVVERGVFRRLGGSRERRIRARIIAATNQDLERKAATGAFRADLLFRLNALTIRIPPLRDRADDIPLIAESVIERLRRQLGKADLRLSSDARAAIERHRWPGNVRELINVLRRGAILANETEITTEELGLTDTSRPAAPRITTDRPMQEFDFTRGGMTLEEVEKRLITAALENARGNVSLAAKLLGLNRGALRYRIERHGLESHARDFSTR